MGWKDRAKPVGAPSWKDKYQKAASESSPEQTGLESFANTATGNYLPHLQALAAKPVYGAMNIITGQDVKPDSYVNERDANIDRIAKQEAENPKAALAGKAAGFGATMALPGGLVSSAAQAALANPGDVKGQEADGFQLEDRAKNAGIASLIGAGGKGLSSGLKGVADLAMQKAAGITRMKPGMGTELINQGVFGTAGMMRKQIGKKIPAAAEELNSVVANHPGQLDSLEIVDQIRNKAEALKVNGFVPKGDVPYFNRLMSTADDVAKTVGPIEGGLANPLDIQKLKASFGDKAFRESGVAGNTNAALAAKEGMSATRKALSDAIGEPYEQKNAVVSALLRGKQGLEKSGISMGDVGQAAGLAGLGYGIGGTEGALGGLALKTNLAKSGGAHLSSLLGKGIGAAAPQAARAYTLFGSKKD